MAAGAAGHERYTLVAIWFHWVIAALVLWNLAGGVGQTLLPEAAAGVFWSGHKAIGVTVLFLSVARLAWRLAHRPPPTPPTPPTPPMPRWQALAAHALHWLFYALIILMPLSGWAFSSAAEKRRPLTFFGLFDIPYLPVPRGSGGVPHDFHVYAGWAMAGLVALHVAAALKHHLVDRDRTLARMLPVVEPVRR